MARRIGEALVRLGAPGRQLLLLDYPVEPLPRRQLPGLRRLLDAEVGTFRHTLLDVAAGVSSLDDRGLPWANPFLPPFDAVTLYGLIASRRPRVYLEIGSGNSTVFARHAIASRSPGTKLVSVDPSPRADVDALCDRLVRARLETTDLDLFSELEEGDLVFFDGSHSAFPNSDVTVFMLEVLPNLAPGVVVGIHDIYIPDDYPPDAAARMWNEQYLVATYLLAAGVEGVRIPNFYLTHYTRLAQELFAETWARLGLVEYHGSAFWLEA